mgnify:FL=1
MSNGVRKIGVKRFKIAKCESRNYKLLKAIGRSVEVIISTDLIIPLSNLDDYYIQWLWCPDSPVKMKLGFKNHQGFSDHTIGLDAAKIALARGASIIEKHFVLDREHSQSPEREWSMEPSELKELKRWENICQQVLK